MTDTTPTDTPSAEPAPEAVAPEATVTITERTITITEPTNYFQLVIDEAIDRSGWELAAHNGIANSRYDLVPGDVVKVPAPQLPVPADPPAVDVATANAQAAATTAATEAAIAGAIDTQAGINPASDASTAGAAPLVVDGGTPPASDPVPDPAPPVDIPAVAALDGGTSTPLVSVPQDVLAAVPDNSGSPAETAQVIRPSTPDNTVGTPLTVVAADDGATAAAPPSTPDPVAEADQPEVGVIPQEVISAPLGDTPSTDAPEGSPIFDSITPPETPAPPAVPTTPEAPVS